MNDTWWIIIQAIVHTCLALLVLCVTWWSIRGLIVSIHSEGDKQHD